MSAFDSLTSRDPNGLTNAAQWQTMGASGIPDPTWAQVYSDDFNQYLAALYSVSGQGTPAVTQASGLGGIINMATSGAAADTTNLQITQAGFQATPGKHLFFKAEFTPVSTAAADLYFGLFPVSASPLAAADFIAFICATGQNQWILRSRVGGVNNDIPLPANLLKVDGTVIELGFHVDRQGNIEAFFNPTTGSNPISASASAGGQPRGRVASYVNPVNGTQLSPTQVLLSPTAGIRTTGAAVRSMTVDFLVCSAER